MIKQLTDIIADYVGFFDAPISNMPILDKFTTFDSRMICKMFTSNWYEKNMKKFKIDFGLLCYHVEFQLIQKYYDSINWTTICSNPNISMWWFEQNFQKLESMSGLCGNSGLTMEWLEKNLGISRIHWTVVFQSSSITDAFLLKYWDKVTFEAFNSNAKISTSILDKAYEEGKLDKGLSWHYVCRNQHIPYQWFEKYLDKVSWSDLIGNVTIPFDWLKQHYHTIISSQSIFNSFAHRLEIANPENLDFLNTIAHKIIASPLGWQYLCCNSNIPLAWLQRHKRYHENGYTWGYLSYRENLFELVEEFKDQIHWHNYSLVAPFEMIKKYATSHMSDCGYKLYQNENIPLHYIKVWLSDYLHTCLSM